MLRIEMKTENTNTTQAPKKRTLKDSRAKLSSTLVYLRSSLIGVLMAMSSFTAALAMQPKLSDATLNTTTPQLVSEATTEDLNILSKYMDGNILNSIETDGKEPYAILIEYLEFDESFESTIRDYFK